MTWLGFMRTRATLRLCVAWSLTLCAPALVHAQAEPPLTRSDFRVDLVTGPIVGPNRVISLGGAYTALAYGIDSAVITPAAYAARTMWDTNWFEWDVTLDYSPGAFRHTDFDNNGESGVANKDFLFVTGGASAALGDLGLGGLVRMQNYRVGDHAQFSLIIANYGICYAFMEGQLLVGVAARSESLTVSDTSTGRSLVQFSGTGPELGAVLGLADLPFRIGFAARLKVDAGPNRDANSLLDLTLPKSVTLPAEVQVGMAYQLGERPLNRRFINPHDRNRGFRDEMLQRRRQRLRDQVHAELAALRLQHALDTAPPPSIMSGVLVEPEWSLEPRNPTFWIDELKLRAREERELKARIAEADARRKSALRALSRRYLLLSADLLLIGETADGVGLESLLSQRRQISGASPSFGVRVGAEGEPIANRVKLRAGSYLEPSRYDGIAPRLHGTVGTDVRLFAWDVFGLMDEFDLRISAAFDLAARYRNFGFSIGIWH